MPADVHQSAPRPRGYRRQDRAGRRAGMLRRRGPRLRTPVQQPRVETNRRARARRCRVGDERPVHADRAARRPLACTFGARPSANRRHPSRSSATATHPHLRAGAGGRRRTGQGLARRLHHPRELPVHKGSDGRRRDTHRTRAMCPLEARRFAVAVQAPVREDRLRVSGAAYSHVIGPGGSDSFAARVTGYIAAWKSMLRSVPAMSSSSATCPRTLGARDGLRVPGEEQVPTGGTGVRGPASCRTRLGPRARRCGQAALQTVIDLTRYVVVHRNATRSSAVPRPDARGHPPPHPGVHHDARTVVLRRLDQDGGHSW